MQQSDTRECLLMLQDGVLCDLVREETQLFDSHRFVNEAAQMEFLSHEWSLNETEYNGMESQRNEGTEHNVFGWSNFTWYQSCFRSCFVS